MSGPTKSVRRIFSLLSIGPNKDPTTSPESISPLGSPRLIQASPKQASPKQLAVDRSHSPVISSESHHHINSAFAVDDDLNANLSPPPSLVALNLARGEIAPSSSDSRPQSRSSSAGGAPTGSRALTLPGTPADEKKVNRRSWMPTKSRTGSMNRRENRPDNRPDAWIAGIEPIIPYDAHALAEGGQVSMLRLMIINVNDG